MGSDGRVHQVAEVGFETAAPIYDRARPDYPAGAVSLLADRLGLTAATTVVDVGAGTGKLTRRLAGTGATVIAVEPSAAMRAELARALPTLELLDGTAESLPLASESVDAVTAGQAFHWFDAPTAVVEIHRVLVPGGGVGLVWNRRDDVTPVHLFLTEIMEPLRGSAPSFERDQASWRTAFGDFAGFHPLQEQQFRQHQRLSPEQLGHRVLSTSVVAVQPVDERARIFEKVRRGAERFADPDGTVTVPYRTLVVWTHKVR